MKFTTNFIKEHRTLALLVLVAVLLIASGIYLATTRIQAVTPAWDWVNQLGGANEDQGKTVARDAAGNVYIAGEFDTSMDFTLGANQGNCPATLATPSSVIGPHIYIAKFTDAGICVWAVALMEALDGDFVNDIAVNSSGTTGEIYLTGYFFSNNTFYASSGGVTAPAFTLLADSSGSALIAKLQFNENTPVGTDDDFAWVWADQLDSVESNQGNALVLDSTFSNVYVTGKFGGLASLLDETNSNISGPVGGPWQSAGADDIFIIGLDSGNGDPSWFKTAGGPLSDLGLGIEINSGVYVTGFFGLHANFGLGETLERHVISNYRSLPIIPFQTITTAFVARFDDSTGDLAWVKQMGGGTGLSINYASDIKADSAGDIYATGMFTNGSTAAFHDLYNVTEVGGVGTAEGQFSGAYGISRDSAGNFYVSDTGNFRIQKFDSNFSFVEMWGWGVDDGSSVFQICTSGCQAGLSGPGAGQFDGPSNIAIDSSDNVYVVDTLNDRVQKFTSAGAFLLMFGKDVDTVDDGGGDNLNICTAAESATCQNGINVGPSYGAYEFVAVFGVSVDSSDNVYTTEEDTNRIQKFDLNGEFIEMWGKDVDTEDEDSNGFNICTANENDTGASSCQAGTASATSGEFDAPKGITIYDSSYLSSEIVLIADSGNDRIQIFDTAGAFGAEFGSTGTGFGTPPGTANFTNPSGVGVDFNENVYVVDTGNHRIQKFDTNFSTTFTWGKDVNADNPAPGFEICVGTIPGVENCQASALGSSVAGEFDSPTSITFDSNKNIYVADFLNSRIQKFGTSANLGLANGPTPRNIFLAKMSPTDGSFDWTRKAETQTDVANLILPSLTIDPSDDSVYVGASFSGTANFDGTGETVSAVGVDDALVFGYDSSGGFLWAQSAGGSMIDYINDIVFDAVNSAWYVAGSSESSDATFGTATGSPFASAGNFDGFLSKLKVAPPPSNAPTLAKNFSPNPIIQGGVSTLTITLTNPNGTSATLTSDFTDTFPSTPFQLVVAPTPNASTTCPPAGILTSSPGDTFITLPLSGGHSIPASGSCTVIVDVTAPSIGSYVNTLPIGALQTSEGPNDTAASDTLDVTSCGDGLVNGGEQCDLGTTNNGSCPKTCSFSCTINSCSGGGPSSFCGDGTTDPGEQCDDGNTVSGDGCSGTCQPESSQTLINGTCGTNNQTYPSSTTNFGTNPPNTFCNSGTATNFSSGNFPTATTPTTWDCAGINGGTTVSCSASLQAPSVATCGTANGQTFQTKPSANLCASNATASLVNGPTNGPWNWLCYIPLSQPFVQTSCSAIAPPTDVCPNIPGNQSTVPPGHVVQNGICVPSLPPPTPCFPGDPLPCPQPPPPPGNVCPPFCPPPPPPPTLCPDGSQPPCTLPPPDPIDPGGLLPPDPIYPPGGGTPPGNGTTPGGGPTGPGGQNGGTSPSGGVLGILKSILPAQLVSQISDIFGSQAGNTTAKALAVLGLVSGMLALLLTDLPFRLLTTLFSFLGVKKKERWGTVFNSITLEGIDPAYVSLKDAQGNEVQTAITDLEGRFGFAAPAPGIYRITANKGDYAFPSAKLAGRTSNALYDNLYFGGDIMIKEAGQIIIANIPMDPLNFDWNQFRKNQLGLMASHTARQKWIARISSFFFGVGFIVSIFALIFAPSPLNVIIFGLYILLFFLRRFAVLRAKRKGSITSLGGVPMSFAILRVHQAGTGVEVAHSVADQYGSFYRLIANGRYFVKIDQKISENDYTTVFVSEPFEVTKGLINSNFMIQ